MAHPVDIHVGKRLRLRRTILGLSQDVLGKAIQVSFQQIQKYERGMNRLGSSRLYDFAKLLKVPVSYFFEGMEDGKASAFSEDIEKQIMTRETMELARAYYCILDPAVRKHVFDMVKSIAALS